MEERRGAKITFNLQLGQGASAQAPTTEDLGPQGLLFRSNDGLLVAQFRTDGFSLHRLRPYTSWAQLFPVAKELWAQYCNVAAPEAVSRLAVRTVNHVDLPPNLGVIEHYLRAAPVIPPELPQFISTFFINSTIYSSDDQLNAQIIQALGPRPAPGKLTLLLDVDAYREGSWATASQEVAQTLEELHEFRNRVFFNLLTDEALARFD